MAKNDKNSVEYMAMCGIFSKVRDNSVTLCYNILKDFFHENYPEDENFRQLPYSAEVIKPTPVLSACTNVGFGKTLDLNILIIVSV